MVLFALADIALSVTWHTSIFVLRGVYNVVYYLYYGSQPSEEEILEMEVDELRDRIKTLEGKLENESNK